MNYFFFSIFFLGKTSGKLIKRICEALRHWQDHFQLKIGGKDRIVKLDHTFGCHTAKYAKGKYLKLRKSDKIQALGGWCANSGAVIFELVPNLSQICTEFVVRNRVKKYSTNGFLIFY